MKTLHPYPFLYLKILTKDTIPTEIEGNPTPQGTKAEGDTNQSFEIDGTGLNCR